MLRGRFKKIGVSILVSILLIQSLGAYPIQFANDRLVNVPTQVKQGATLVELKTVGEMMNLEVTWNGADKSIKLQDIGNTLILYVGKAKGSFNGQSIKVESAPIVTEGLTYVPLRLVAEHFGYKLVSNQGTIFLTRTMTQEEKAILSSWEEKRENYRGMIYAIMAYKEGVYSIEELPIEGTRQEILLEIQKVEAIIAQKNVSSLLKVLGREYIGALKAADALYAVADKEDAFNKLYNTAVYKLDYFQYEYSNLQNNVYSAQLAKQDFADSPYDELRVSLGYTYLFIELRDMLASVSKYYGEERVEIMEISYRIAIASLQRENLKYLRSILRSQEAEKVLDTYIAYADAVITYYCEVRRYPKEPERVNKKYKDLLSKLDEQVEVTYSAYRNFNKGNS